MVTHQRRTSSSQKPNKPRLRKIVAYAILAGAIFSLLVVTILWLFGNSLLNHFAKPRIEAAFDKAHPRLRLRLGTLTYHLADNELTCRAAALQRRDSNLVVSIGTVSVRGVRWHRLLQTPRHISRLLEQAVITFHDSVLKWTNPQYELRCQHLRMGIREGTLKLAGLELAPTLDPERFFAASPFRRTRFHLQAPDCQAEGLACLDLLQGQSYRARLIQIRNPSLDAFVNRDKPANTNTSPTHMPNEELASIKQLIQIDRVEIMNGRVRYAEQRVADGPPGQLTFDNIDLTGQGIGNRIAAPSTTRLHGVSRFMNAGRLELALTIPADLSDFNLHHTGSLSAMDLTALNGFLPFAEHTRISNGFLEQANFDIQVASGQASGQLEAIYQDLKIALLDLPSGSAQGIRERVGSAIANHLKLRTSNPGKSGVVKIGEVNYNRQPGNNFLQYLWFAVRSGVAAVVGF